MNIEVVSKEVDVTTELQDRLERKLERILERRNKEQPVRVLMSESRGRFQTQISMYIHGKEVLARSEEKNLVAAVDEAIDKVERQVARIHEKVTQKR